MCIYKITPMHSCTYKMQPIYYIAPYTEFLIATKLNQCYGGNAKPIARHGIATWGHGAKITKIGVNPTRDSPGQGKSNGSKDRRQDVGPISECTTWN